MEDSQAPRKPGEPSTNKPPSPDSAGGPPQEE